MDIPGTEQNGYNAKRFYLTIYGGKLAQSMKEGDEGAVSRINKKDKKVWEKHYDSITGILKDVFFHTGNFGDEIHIKVAPNGESEVIIQMPFDSKYANEFLMKLPNIELIEPVTIRPYNFDDKEKKDKDGKPKKVIGIALSQSLTKIGKYYTYEEPNGYPMSEMGEDGKRAFLEADDFKILNIQQKKFLKQELEKWRSGEKPEVKAPEPETPAKKKKKVKEENAEAAGYSANSDDSSLPF